MVIVPMVPLAVSNVAVSCASGKLFAAGVPPDVVAHPVADQFTFPASFQYFGTPAGNVMPELFPQSPTRNEPAL